MSAAGAAHQHKLCTRCNLDTRPRRSRNGIVDVSTAIGSSKGQTGSYDGEILEYQASH